MKLSEGQLGLVRAHLLYIESLGGLGARVLSEIPRIDTKTKTKTQAPVLVESAGILLRMRLCITGHVGVVSIYQAAYTVTLI